MAAFRDLSPTAIERANPVAQVGENRGNQRGNGVNGRQDFAEMLRKTTSQWR
jgi:hypothetical protein